MCKVRVKNIDNNVGFVIYNHLFSKEKYGYVFTTEGLRRELRQYNLNLSTNAVQHEVDSMVKAGLVSQTYKDNKSSWRSKYTILYS